MREERYKKTASIDLGKHRIISSNKKNSLINNDLLDMFLKNVCNNIALHFYT
jgi:hypothetical protein